MKTLNAALEEYGRLCQIHGEEMFKPRKAISAMPEDFRALRAATNRVGNTMDVLSNLLERIEQTMLEDFNVSGGAHYWRVRHRNVKIDRAANGYIVEYKRVAIADDNGFNIRTEQRVFVNLVDALSFIDRYFTSETSETESAW